MNTMRVFVEAGQKKTFAGALDWPGWCRSGRDEVSALQALLNYAPRYARVLQAGGVAFQLPGGVADFKVVERQAGDASTEFGVPHVSLNADREPLYPGELEHFTAILRACWLAFDQAVLAASGAELRKGPRGGGRDLAQIFDHIVEADRAYLARLSWKDTSESQGEMRPVIVRALEMSARGDLPTQGPRGGQVWPARYFLRRVAWHVLDHAWEIEDRL